MARKKSEVQIQFKAVTSEFTQGIIDCNKSIKTMQNELKLNSAQLKNNSEDTGLLADRQKILQQELEQAQEKVELTNQKMEKAKEVLGENSTEYQQLANAVLRAKTQQQNIQNELDNTTNKLEQLENATQQAENGLDGLGDSADDSVSALDKLKNTITQQENKLGQLKDKYTDLVVAQGKGTQECKELANEISDLSRELKENKEALDDAEQSANEFDNTLSDTGSGIKGFINQIKNIQTSGEGAKAGIVAIGTAVGQLASNVIQGAIGKIKEFTDYLWELPEATREFRTNMDKVQASASQYGVSTEEATEQTKQFYSYLGDDMASANCTTNLLGLKLTQEDLMKTSNAAIAVWTAYGDSIPIEGLTESINETAQVGKVTGNLADALNWAGISEDDFNTKLEKTKGTQERAKLITDTLNKAYGESKNKFDEMAKGTLEYNSSVFELQESQSRLADVIEPLQSRFNILKATLLEKLTPVIMTICDWIDKLIGWFNGLSPEMQNTILIIAGVVGAITGIIAVVGVVISVISVVSTALTILNISLLPIIAIIAGIVVAITAVILVIRNWGAITDWLGQKWSQFSTWIGEIWNSICTAASQTWNNIKVAATNMWNDICTSIGNICNNIKTTVSNIWNSIKTAISNILNRIKMTVTNIWNNIKTTISNIINTVKSIVRTGFNLVKTYVVNPIKGAYTNVLSIFTNIYTTIRDKINNARDVVKTAIYQMKGFFNFKWSLPKIKLPHFSVSGSANPIDWLSQGVPKINVQWYAKGGIMTQPTLFGGGEAGDEAILPLKGFYNYLDNKLATLKQQTIDYDALGDAIVQSLKGLGIYMDKKVVGELVAEEVDNTNSSLKDRLNRLGGVK